MEQHRQLQAAVRVRLRANENLSYKLVSPKEEKQCVKERARDRESCQSCRVWTRPHWAERSWEEVKWWGGGEAAAAPHRQDSWCDTSNLYTAQDKLIINQSISWSHSLIDLFILLIALLLVTSVFDLVLLTVLMLDWFCFYSFIDPDRFCWVSLSVETSEVNFCLSCFSPVKVLEQQCQRWAAWFN